jgi:hypothetical protein
MQFITASPSLNWTVAKMDAINNTVLVLSGDLATSATKLNSAVTDINAFFLGSNPGQLATDMTSNVGALAPLSAGLTTTVNNLNTGLTTAATNLDALANYNAITNYRNYIAAVRWGGSAG